MTATLSDANRSDSSEPSSKKKSEPTAEQEAAAKLVRAAKEQGLSLTGPDGLLKQFTKNVLETALGEEMTEWSNRPLDGVYAAIVIVVKIRDGQVANQPIYAAVGVTLAGEKNILGFWAGTGGEGAKFWMSVLTDIRNRGVKDVFFLVCDGLKGLPEVVGNVWPLTTVQTCIIHLIRNTFRLASKRDWDALKRDVKPLQRDHQAVGVSLGGAHTVPRLRHRDQTRHLQHERDREPQRPLPPSRSRPADTSRTSRQR